MLSPVAGFPYKKNIKKWKVSPVKEKQSIFVTLMKIVLIVLGSEMIVLIEVKNGERKD